MGGIADFLGMSNNSDQAKAYTSNPSAYRWGGPSQNQLSGYLSGAQNQAGQDYGQQQQVNQGQSDYMKQLQQSAAGNGPSQAAAVLGQGANRAAAQSMSLARSGGGNPAAQAANMRAAMQQGASGITNAGGQAAMIKSQEQMNALNQMGGALGQQRAQDLQAMGMGNQMAGTYLGAQMGQANAQLGASMGQDQLNAQNYNATQGIRAAADAQNAATNAKLVAGGAEAAGSLAMFSDIRAKTDINGNSGPNLGGPGHEVYDLPELDASGPSAGIRSVDPTMGGQLGTPEAAAAFNSSGGGGPGGPPTPGAGDGGGGGGGSNVLGNALKGFSAGFNGQSYRAPTSARPVSNKVSQQPGMQPALPSPPPPPGAPGGWQSFGGDPNAQSAQSFQAPPLNPNMAITVPDLQAGMPPPYVPSDERAKVVSQGLMRGPTMGPAMSTGRMLLAGPGDPNRNYLHHEAFDFHPEYIPPSSIMSDERVKTTTGRLGPIRGGWSGSDDDGGAPAIGGRFGTSNLRGGGSSYTPPRPSEPPTIGGRFGIPRREELPDVISSDERLKTTTTGEDPSRFRESSEANESLYKPHNERSLLNRREDPGSASMITARSGGRSLESMTRDDENGEPMARRPSAMRATMGDTQNIYSDEHLKKLGLSKKDLSLLDTRVEDTPERRARMAEDAGYRARINESQRASNQFQQRQFEGDHPELANKYMSPPIDEEMSEADHFLNHLRPYTYRYKDPSYEPSSQPNGGHYLGVMAQDVERTPGVGSQIVKDTPRGKVLEGGAMMSAMAAGLGRLHERVQQIEGARKGPR